MVAKMVETRTPAVMSSAAWWLSMTREMEMIHTMTQSPSMVSRLMSWTMSLDHLPQHPFLADFKRSGRNLGGFGGREREGQKCVEYAKRRASERLL